MKYEIIFLDELYCLFIDNRIQGAYKTFNEAKKCKINIRRKNYEQS